MSGFRLCACTCAGRTGSLRLHHGSYNQRTAGGLRRGAFRPPQNHRPALGGAQGSGRSGRGARQTRRTRNPPRPRCRPAALATRGRPSSARGRPGREPALPGASAGCVPAPGPGSSPLAAGRAQAWGASWGRSRVGPGHEAGKRLPQTTVGPSSPARGVPGPGAGSAGLLPSADGTEGPGEGRMLREPRY